MHTITMPRPTRDKKDCTQATATRVDFTLDRPDAQVVYLSGSFNEWSPRGLRLFRRRTNGLWARRVSLEPGRYQYKFVVDEEWIHDPAARENVPNEYGTLNSIIDVHNGAPETDYDPCRDKASRAAGTVRFRRVALGSLFDNRKRKESSQPIRSKTMTLL